jgi:hypothetical protein
MTDPILVTARPLLPELVGPGFPCWSINVGWDGSGVEGVHHVSIDRTDVTARRSTLTVRTKIAVNRIRSPWTDNTGNVNRYHRYFYTVNLWNGGRQPLGRGDSEQGNPGDVSPRCSSPRSSGALTKTIPGTFELLVPQEAVINDFIHEEGSILEGQWAHVHTLKAPDPFTQTQAISVSFLQTSSGEFKAIARERPPQGEDGDYLVAYERTPDADPASDWQEPVQLVADDRPIDGVTGTPALIQSHQDSFVLLVPRGAVIDHYAHLEGTILEGQWIHIHTLKAPEENVQITAVALTQTVAGTFLAIARVSPPHKSDYLVAYELGSASDAADEFDSVSISESVSSQESVPDSAPDWQGPVILVAVDGPIDNVTGSPAFIQDEQGIFELLVPQGTFINHYTHKAVMVVKGPWTQIHTLKSPDNNAQITANWFIQSTSGALDAVARISPPAGGGNDYLVGYELLPGAEWKGPMRLVADDGPVFIGE